MTQGGRSPDLLTVKNCFFYLSGRVICGRRVLRYSGAKSTDGDRIMGRLNR